MGKAFGFLDHDRKVHDDDPVEDRLKNFNEFYTPLAEDDLKIQGARCMDCGTPFCQPACPLHNVIPDFIDLVLQGRLEGSL